MKKILVLHYSQTGQLTEIVNQFIGPLEKEFSVDSVVIQPVQPFPFPWTTDTFFDIMPETYMEEPVPIQTPTFKEDAYDLIILGYQPWFLSPSLPTTSIVKSEWFKKLAKGKPVVTLIGARNMWLNANRKLRRQFDEVGCRHVGNIPLYDKHNNLVSGVTIVHWMFTGQKTKKWNIFPRPGVTNDDIKNVKEEGELLSTTLQNGQLEQFQEKAVALEKMKIPTPIWFIESRAKKLFRIWAEIIKRKGTTPKKRKKWVKIYQYYLVFALFILSPIVVLIFSIFVRPFIFLRIREDKLKILKLQK